MKKVIVVLNLLILIGCSGSDVPSSQTEFARLILAFEDRYKAADRSGNEVQKSAVEAEIIQFLRETPHRADDWRATVKSISDGDGHRMVVAKHRDMEFTLKLIDEKAKLWGAGLERGAEIEFSGQLGRENSITIYGGLAEPEFAFFPEQVRVVGGAAVVQAKSLIEAALAAKAQISADISIQSEVTVGCHDAVIRRLKIPESASFSWLKGSYEKQADGVWVYSNVVEAKNDLGNAIPHRFICKAAVLPEEKETSIKVTALTFL